MSWVRSDDNEPNHPKIFLAGIAAYGFFQAAKCYCSRYLTDGFIPVGNLSLIFPGMPFKTAMKLTIKLVECGLFDKQETPPGWRVHDYLDYNLAREEVLDRRVERAASGRRGGLAKARADAKPELDVSQHTSPAPTLPCPTLPEEKTEALSGSRPTRARLNGFSDESKAILQWLNDKASKHFRPVAEHLRLIDARLKDHEPWVLRKVVTVKVREWSEDPKSAIWLRPATLFAATNFENYVGELPAESES